MRNRYPGFTLVEILVAVSVVSIGFIGCWMGLGQCFRVAAAHRETIAATECLMQRIEQTRASGWTVLTSGTGIYSQILNSPPSSASSLSQLQEQITVSPYPPLIPAPTPIVVVRNANGTEQIVSQPATGFDLRSVLAVRADLQLTWQSSVGQRQRVRQISTVIALDALLK